MFHGLWTRYGKIVKIVQRNKTRVSIMLDKKRQDSHKNNLFFFDTTTVVGQGLPVPLVDLAFSGLLISPNIPRIFSPTYGGTVYLGLEPMTGMLLNRTS